MKFVAALIALAFLLCACSESTTSTVVGNEQPVAGGWQTDFFDDFDTVNADNWQDQILSVNDEDQFPEALFAILNFARINDSAMTRNWVMEVDWVKHERWVTP